mgnify:CR=1 FL=1
MLTAGAGRADITPPIGIAHAGWGAATHQRAEGVDMPFYATALYVTDGDLELAIVDLDIGILTNEDDAAIRAEVEAVAGIKPENLRLSATHTHSGPVNRGSWLDEGMEMVGPYWDSLPARVAEAVNTARWEAKTAHVGVGKGTSSINVNRRPALPDGTLFTGRNWDGFVDREVGIVAINDTTGNPISTLLNYTCHPTILGPANKLLSPDYPGTARKIVEQHVGGLCLFLQGAAGNCGPTHGFIGETEVAQRLGTRLGLEAARVRLEIDPVPRKERLVEVVPSGADLGMYEDEPDGEPDDTLRVVNASVELPVGNFPSIEDARAEFDSIVETLNATRKNGTEDEIKEAVKNAKRSNFVLGNAHQLSMSLLMPSSSIASVIANEFNEAYTDLHRSSLIALGFLLFVVTFIVLLLARLMLDQVAWKLPFKLYRRTHIGRLLAPPVNRVLVPNAEVATGKV